MGFRRDLGSGRARRLVAAIALGSLLPALLGAAPVAAANNTTVYVVLGDFVIFGSNAGANKNVKIEWRADDGDLKSKQQVTSNGFGEWLSKPEVDEYIEVGDTIKTTTGMASFTYTVPPLTVQVDRANDTVSGSTLPNQNVQINVTHYNGFLPAPGGGAGPFSDASGNYSAFFGAINLKGFDEVMVEITSARGDTTATFRTVQAIALMVKRSTISIFGNPGDVEVQLWRTDQTMLDAFQTRLDQFGQARADFWADGRPLKVREGDNIQGSWAGDADINIPTMTVTPNKSTNKVTVNCGPNRGVFVDIHTRDQSRFATRVGTADSAGNYVANFAVAPRYDVKANDKIIFGCSLATGDVVQKPMTVQ